MAQKIRGLAALLWMLTLFALPALAEGAAINGPTEFSFDRALSGVSSALIDLTLDVANDETRLVNEYGSIRMQMDMYDEQGNDAGFLWLVLTDSPYGRAIITGSDNPHSVTFEFEDRMLALRDDGLVSLEASQGPFEAVWSAMYFPYMPDAVYYAAGSDSSGHSFYRLRGTDVTFQTEGECEHMVDAKTQRLKRTVAYIPDESGHLYKYVDIAYTLDEPYPLPDVVASAMEDSVSIDVGSGKAPQS
mgnify:CR=1 FL=1